MSARLQELVEHEGSYESYKGSHSADCRTSLLVLRMSTISSWSRWDVSKRPTTAVRSLILVLAVAGSLTLMGCDEVAGCANMVVREVLSPDGAFKATLFQRDCGSTTAFTSQVSITPGDGAVSYSGNTFIADTDHGAARAGVWGGPEIEIAWQGPNQLVISYAANARIFRREAKVLDVSVHYRSLGQ